MINQISTFSSPALFSFLQGAAQRQQWRRGSGRYVGQCPKCGGSARTDRFVMQDDGGFKCYSCGFKGDIITWMREVEGKTCGEAHDVIGIECRVSSCAKGETCRQSGSQTKRRRPLRQALQPRLTSPASTIANSAIKGPQQLWQAWAIETVEKAAISLQAQPSVLSYLKGRGISEAAVQRFRLGYMHHDRQVYRRELGLGDKDGKEKLWIPGGLLIPIFMDGAIHRLRVRRTKEAMERFLPDRKYVWIEGSGSAPLVIPPLAMETPRGAVIVEAELDAMAVADAHHQVVAIALGTVQGGVPDGLRQSLEQIPAILVALDADAGREGAGPKAVKAWLRTFRQARFWPVPEAKDAGDYAKAGGDLTQWVEVGLPQQVRPVKVDQKPHDSAFCPDSSQRGGGEDKHHFKEVAVGTTERVIALHDGREIYIVDNEADWHRLTDMGRVVFSENELTRLQQACATMGDDERRSFVLQVVSTKEVFPGAWIREGKQVAAAPLREGLQ